MDTPPSPPDMKAILVQHRKTYEIPTNVGVIILRHLRRLDADRITAVLIRTVPGYARAMQELGDLTRLVQFCEQAPKAPPMRDAQLQRLNELLAWAAPYLDVFACACFVQPPVNTTEELEALGNALEPEEWVKVQGLLTVLSNTAPSFEERELAFLNRLKSYGIPLANDLSGEDLTIDQSRALEQASELEEIAIGQIFGGQ